MPIIKKLDVYLVKKFLLLFAATFFISLFVLMMQMVFMRVDDLIGKGLTLDILGRFFWYMSLTFIPQAIPLALLLSSLITMGNLGESSELTAIKASGISLLQALRSLIVFSVLLFGVSLYFQNEIGPSAANKMAQIFISMRQKSPELEIPEGIFYDGIPGSNIYVQRKNMDTGKLYGIMIYQTQGSYEDAEIILADSGMLQSTAEKKHLLLTLYSGRWFRNLRSQEMAGAAAVPFGRETFWRKNILIDFDADFNMADASLLASNARGKGWGQLAHDIDSLNHAYDSIGHDFLKDVNYTYFERTSSYGRDISAPQNNVSKKAEKPRLAEKNAESPDSIYLHLSQEQKRRALNEATGIVQQIADDLEYKSLITSDGDKIIRQHETEIIRKFTMALSCIIFFFIGAPLGAIIRKGGLGMPVIISVFVYIVYYILDNTGYRMAKGGMWTIWFGMSLSTVVLAPLAVFFTHKANNDSMVFNADLYREMFLRLLGLRLKRHVNGKEVIINDPNYAGDISRLTQLSSQVTDYATTHRLKSAPNVAKVFFKYEPDHEVERISEELEEVIEDLGNSRDRHIIGLLNEYPILSVKAHTRPFERRWMNILSAIVLPVGAALYFRMWRFRLRLQRDLTTICRTNDAMIKNIERVMARH